VLKADDENGSQHQQLNAKFYNDIFMTHATCQCSFCSRYTHTTQ